ncbi:MAG: cryptochrome/photolyase family protein [Acidimicrobiales bacterium]
MRSIVWFRRDLRLHDHPALAAAAARGPVLGLFVVDPALAAPVGPTRGWYLSEALASLDASSGHRLVIRVGDPAEVLVAVAREVGADAVYATGETTPRGRARDAAAAAALARAGIAWRPLQTPYVVDPGTLRQRSGRPYRVFGAYARAWADRAASAPGPVEAPPVTWVVAEGSTPVALRDVVGTRRPAHLAGLPAAPAPARPPAGEDVALATLLAFVGGADGYGATRDQLGRDATSRLSPHLHVGALHPRTVLAALDAAGQVAPEFRRQLVWREFYADVLWHDPHSAWHDLRGPGAPAPDRDDAALERFGRWARGDTGLALVDAGMRQLLTEGWMPNRARLVCASFLVKHLHLDWRWGASWFLWRLVDGDVASNQHGWQWVAGTGTDAAPYHRVFNPVRQAERFDPEGDYARRHLPERYGPHAAAPPAMVDLAVERREALARAARARGTR